MSESFRRAVLLDSSAILALADASDRHHREAIAIAARLGAERRPVFVTHAIELEAHALLLRKLGRGPAREWLLRGGLSVVRATRGEEDAARELIASHEDKDWSLCDALSFVLIVQRRAAGAFSFDHHFRQVGTFRVWGEEQP
jgi:predicted nucleic acid-binding protein